MFATQRYGSPGLDSGRKRFRNDEDSTVNATGFGEHRNKRLQSLPLRSSPRTAQQPLPPSIVPLNANPAEAGPQPHLDAWAPSSASGLELQQSADCADFDMMMDADTTPLPGQDVQAQAHASTLQVDCPTGRIPTPIQPNFAAQIRGQHGGWSAAESTSPTPNGVVNLGHHVTGLSQEQSTPRGMANESDWHVLQTNRRLPSPISEVGDFGMGGHEDVHGGIMMDAETQPHPAQEQMSTSLPVEQSSTMLAMEHPNAMMETDAHHHLASQLGESETDPSSPSPNRRGHQRSKHTVNSWTWQPGMKKSFSIGYRSDCEKCRLKVPGHFNHIVIS